MAVPLGLGACRRSPVGRDWTPSQRVCAWWTDFRGNEAREVPRCRVQGWDFGCRDANAFVVFVYALWEHRCRPKLARLFDVEDNAVNCVLMGDIRYVRHAILHTGWKLPERYRRNLKILPLLWGGIPEGELRISAHMVTELMKQINALRVEIQ